MSYTVPIDTYVQVSEEYAEAAERKISGMQHTWRREYAYERGYAVCTGSYYVPPEKQNLPHLKHFAGDIRWMIETVLQAIIFKYSGMLYREKRGSNNEHQTGTHSSHCVHVSIGIYLHQPFFPKHLRILLL